MLFVWIRVIGLINKNQITSVCVGKCILLSWSLQVMENGTFLPMREVKIMLSWWAQSLEMCRFSEYN